MLASALVVALHVVNELGGWEKRLFDVTEEQNLPTWLNTVQFAGAALPAALAPPRLRGNGSPGGPWPRSSSSSRWTSSRSCTRRSSSELPTSPEVSPWFWPFFYGPIAFACLVAVAATARDVRHALGSIRLLVAGFACLGVALVLDGASAEYMDEPWLWHPSVVVEESLELLGPLLLAVVGLASGREESLVPRRAHANDSRSHGHVPVASDGE